MSYWLAQKELCHVTKLLYVPKIINCFKTYELFMCFLRYKFEPKHKLQNKELRTDKLYTGLGPVYISKLDLLL